MYTVDPFRHDEQMARSEERAESLHYTDPGPVEPNENILTERDFPIGENDIDALPLADIEFLASLQFPFFPER